MYTKILVPLDGTALAEQALPTAVSLVQQMEGELELAIVHETESFDGMPDAPWNAMSETMQESYVADKAKQVQSASATAVRSAVLRGDIADEICRHAGEVKADLIVMSTHGYTGLTRALQGSVADAVIRNAGIPVLLLRPASVGVPAETPTTFQKILILIDGSTRSHAIVDAVRAVTVPGVTQFTMLQVVTPVLPVVERDMLFGYVPNPVDAGATDALVDNARMAMQRLADELATFTGCHVEVCVVVDDHPAAAISAFAQRHEFDLLALTTRGRGASRFLLGSVTDQLLGSSALPMLVVRPPV